MTHHQDAADAETVPPADAGHAARMAEILEAAAAGFGTGRPAAETVGRLAH